MVHEIKTKPWSTTCPPPKKHLEVGDIVLRAYGSGADDLGVIVSIREEDFGDESDDTEETEEYSPHTIQLFCVKWSDNGISEELWEELLLAEEYYQWRSETDDILALSEEII